MESLQQQLKDDGAQMDICSTNINMLLEALDIIEDVPGVAGMVRDLKAWKQEEIQTVAMNDLIRLMKTPPAANEPIDLANLRFMLSYCRNPWPEEVQHYLPTFLKSLIQSLIAKVRARVYVAFLSYVSMSIYIYIYKKCII